MALGQGQGWMWTNTSPHIVEFLLPQVLCHMDLYTFSSHAPTYRETG